jgi:hypothetical protein
VLAAALSSIAFGGASGQTLAVGDPWEEYLRVLQTSGRVDSIGSFTVRPSLDLDAAPAGPQGSHPWVGRVEGPAGPTDGALATVVVPPELRAYANSRFPVGRNDGAVWQGRGLTTALEAGGVLTWRALTIEVRPLLLFNQNMDPDLAPVEVAGMPVYAYPWRKIDWPQQFGPDAYWSLDPGQSQVRVDAWGASAGVSTQNLSWGPSVRNPIIMSNNAAGIPHAFLATDGPLGIGIGKLEGRWIWGRLQQSDWFDPAVPTDDRFLTAIVLTYSPSFLSGLSLGLSRVFYEFVPPSGVPLEDYFAVFSAVRKKSQVGPDNPEGIDEFDQLLSIFGRWVLPGSGFEVFWEWARNDHSWELRDFLLEPEHSQAYTLGLVKSLEMSSNRLLSLGFELSHLERGTTFQVRSNGTYYEHGIVTQGYTQGGQIIGAAIGPGGNAQALWLDLYAPWGRAGTWLERQVHNNDAYYEWAAANDLTYCCHDVSFHWGTHALFFAGQWELGGGMIVTREMNRWFYGIDLWNLNLSASARWRPR